MRSVLRATRKASPKALAQLHPRHQDHLCRQHHLAPEARAVSSLRGPIEATADVRDNIISGPIEATADELLDQAIARAQAERKLQEAMSTPLPLTDSQAEVGRCFAPHGSDERNLHLEKFMEAVGKHHPEYEDAYNERWSEFRPGHPQFNEAVDGQDIQRWIQKASHGVPIMPAGGCPHVNTTFAGTNMYYKIKRCKDCGFLLEREKLEPQGDMETHNQEDCKHVRKDRRGSTATTWKWKCKDCGKKESGRKSEATSTSSTTPFSSSMATSASTSTATRQVVAMMDLTLEIQEEMGHSVPLSRLDKIYEKCKASVAKGLSAEASQSSAATKEEVKTSRAAEEVSGDSIMTEGVHKGKKFSEIYDKEANYVKSMIAKCQSGHLKSEAIKKFADYAMQRKELEKYSRAYMFAGDEVLDDEFYMVAILDTGCNHTCHGQRWMERYMKSVGQHFELEESYGNFKGVGGKVEVKGKRTLTLNMKTLDEDFVPGMITSVELGNSDAPLLLSVKAQKALGLVLDVGAETAYSKTLERELELTQHNGLPGIKLYPGDWQAGSIALQAVNSYLEDPIKSTSPSSTVASTNDADEAVEAISLNDLKIEDCPVKTMTKGQRKGLQEGTEAVSREDHVLWGSLSPKMRKPAKMLPKGCKSFLLELFAGAATLSMMAIQLGYTISSPIDIEMGQDYDLFVPENRQRISRLIEEEDPWLLTMSPVCGPWSPWQSINMSKSMATKESIEAQRKKWYPVIKWLTTVIKERLCRGREVLLENPWPSLLWKLRCMEEIINGDFYNHNTGEPLEVVKLDQCEYGLVDPANVFPHKKATGMMLSSAKMKEKLSTLCSGQHEHSVLEGSNKTKLAQQWPPQLCEAILSGALDELETQTMSHAFAAEFDMEEDHGVETIDSIQTIQDLAEESPLKRRRVGEADHEEDLEEKAGTFEESIEVEKERKRRDQWLQLPKEKRVAIRRLHNMMGHCSIASMTRMLKASAIEQSVINGVKHFRCQICEDLKNEEAPRSTAVTKEPHKLRFNHEVSVDVFEVKDAGGARHSVLSIVDLASRFQVACRVASGGVPTSQACAEAYNQSWLSWAGAPKILVADQGVHNKGKFAALVTSHGTTIKQVGLAAPHQLGIGERQGGLLKRMMIRAIHSHQLIGGTAIAALCSECAKVKNNLLNNGGYTPSQWVMGHTPEDVSSMMNHDPVKGSERQC